MQKRTLLNQILDHASEQKDLGCLFEIPRAYFYLCIYLFIYLITVGINDSQS